MSEILSNFHFLRSLWLLALIPAIAIWWRLHRFRDPRTGLTEDIAPHLLDRLVTTPADRPRLRPTEMILPMWLIAVLAIAGPSWRRLPSPFAEDTSRLILVVKMTPSMLTSDLQPSRLEKSRTKIHDLLELLEGGGTALITYAGSAHLVMPTTEDRSVIDHMLEALEPAIMPVDGDTLAQGLALASKQMEQNAGAASILVVADSVEASQIGALATWRETHQSTVQVMAPLRDEATLKRSGIPEAAQALGARVQLVTPDTKDIERIAGRAEQAMVAAENSDETQWRDDGYFLLPILAVGVLLWSRRGWSVDT